MKILNHNNKNLLAILDIIRAISLEGLTYAHDKYDIDRYERLEKLATEFYSDMLNIDKVNTSTILKSEFGCITPKVGLVMPIYSFKNHMLILRRLDDNRWCYPCGWMNVGEEIFQAAMREVYEETGLKIVPKKIIDVITKGPDKYPDIIHYQINLIIESDKINDNELIKLNYEHSTYGWFNNDDVSINWHSGHEVVHNIMRSIDAKS